MARVKIEVKKYGVADSQGRFSHDLIYTDLEGEQRMQTYFADPVSTVARLRHNIADNFWFHRMRKRLLSENRDE